MVEVFASIKPRKQKAFSSMMSVRPSCVSSDPCRALSFCRRICNYLSVVRQAGATFWMMYFPQLSPDFLRLQSGVPARLETAQFLAPALPTISKGTRFGSVGQSDKRSSVPFFKTAHRYYREPECISGSNAHLFGRSGSVDIRYDTKHVDGKTSEAALLALLQHYRQRDIILKSHNRGSASR